MLQLNQKYQILTHDLKKKNTSYHNHVNNGIKAATSIPRTQILVFHVLTNHLPIFLGEVPAQILSLFLLGCLFLMMELKDFFMYSEYEFIIRYMFHAYFLPFYGCIIYFLEQFLIMMKFNSYIFLLLQLLLSCVLSSKNSNGKSQIFKYFLLKSLVLLFMYKSMVYVK